VMYVGGGGWGGVGVECDWECQQWPTEPSRNTLNCGLLCTVPEFCQTRRQEVKGDGFRDVIGSSKIYVHPQSGSKFYTAVKFL
jgi:hypothetical protein